MQFWRIASTHGEDANARPIGKTLGDSQGDSGGVFAIRGRDENVAGIVRANRTAKPSSDLDLVIISDDKIPFRTLALLREAFTDSDLPFRVDVVKKI